MTTAREPRVLSACSDCGREDRFQSQSVIDDFGEYKDPGETLCPSCRAARAKLGRKIRDVPDFLTRSDVDNKNRNRMCL